MRIPWFCPCTYWQLIGLCWREDPQVHAQNSGVHFLLFSNLLHVEVSESVSLPPSLYPGKRSQDRSVNIAGCPGFVSRLGQEMFLYSTSSRPALEAHPTSYTMIQWVPGALCLRGWSGRGTKLTTHLHLVPVARMAELYLHSLLLLHGVVDWLSTETTLVYIFYASKLLKSHPGSLHDSVIFKHSLNPICYIYSIYI
jgi:hypothetical protein